MTITRTELEIYFGINLLITGGYFVDSAAWGGTTVWKMCLGVLGRVIAGGLYYVVIFLYVVAGIAFSPLWKWLDSKTMIPFYFGICTFRYHNFDELGLILMNNKVSNMPEGKTKNKWQTAIKLVNRINHFIPQIPSDGNTE